MAVLVVHVLIQLSQEDSRIQKHLSDKENTRFLIITPRYFILWDQNQFHTTYIEASTVDIEHLE